jgi:hypothetical protein
MKYCSECQALTSLHFMVDAWDFSTTIQLSPFSNSSRSQWLDTLNHIIVKIAH